MTAESPVHAIDRPLFTQRYGISNRDDVEPWARRHQPLVTDEPRSPQHGCRCPGTRLNCKSICIQRATQEDILCDACRDWCVGIDELGNYHRFADIYGGSE